VHTTARDRAAADARASDRAALEEARAVAEPLDRSKALARVAFHGSAADFDAVIDEAIDAAWEAEEPFRTVTALAWAVRALLECDERDDAAEVVDAALEEAATEPNGLDRLESLFVLWEAVLPFGAELRDRVLPHLVRAAHESDSWRGAHRLRSAVASLGAHDRSAAGRLLAEVPDGKYRRAAQRDLDECVHPAGWWFFDPRR
jgi:hypothetical protein